MKLQATQVMIAFQVEGDRESDLVSLLQTITQIALLVWGFWQWVNRVRRQVESFCQDLQIAARLTISDLQSFGFNSVVLGMG